MLPLIALAALAADPSDRIVVTGRPWAPFISPMGEPFRARTSSDDTLASWFRQADKNNDGVLSANEMLADADRFFATLDSDHDGEIDPTELSHYEYEIAPEIQVTSRKMHAPGQSRERRETERRGVPGSNLDAALGLRGALQGGARYGLLNIPEPVAAADSDFDRGVSLTEFREAALRRFQLLDTGLTGAIRLDQLQTIRQAASNRRPKTSDEAADERVGNGLPAGN